MSMQNKLKYLGKWEKETRQYFMGFAKRVNKYSTNILVGTSCWIWSLTITNVLIINITPIRILAPWVVNWMAWFILLNFLIILGVFTIVWFSNESVYHEKLREIMRDRK